MIEALARLLGRLPEPIVTLVPILLAFLGPGLVLALVAFSVRVPYPQETMGTYSHAARASVRNPRAVGRKQRDLMRSGSASGPSPCAHRRARVSAS